MKVTNMPDTPPTLPKWLKPANRMIIVLNRIGLHIGTMHVLTIPGRKTGKLRSTPVSVLVVQGQRYILIGTPGATRKFCTPEVMQQEAEYLSALESAQQFQLIEGRLEITCTGGGKRLGFRAI